jgi:hypothetical protein
VPTERLTLRRLRAGKYETRDGRFQIVNDPGGYHHRLLGGRTGWLVYERGGDAPSLDGPDMPYPTLADARNHLEDFIGDG